MATTLVHPWVAHRVALHLTQASVAETLGVTRHYYLRLEQGLFRTVPNGVLGRLGRLYGIRIEQLADEYATYIKNTRAQFKDNYENLEVLYHYGGEKHPLQYWREEQGLSRIGLCKGLCLHQRIIRDYELNQQRHIPEQLSEALAEIGWDEEPLVGAVAAWRIKWR